VYREFKHTQGPNGSDDTGIEIRLSGSGNIVRNNRIYYGLIGINITGVPDVEVYGNIISDMYSIGLCTSSGTNGVFSDNLIFSNGINLRIHCYNVAVSKLASSRKRKEYYYRNFFYSPGNSGQVFIHYYPSSVKFNKIQNPDEEPEIFFYHNTFAGGEFNLSSLAKESAGMKKTVIVNNICSFSKGNTMTGRLKGIWDIPETFEVVDYNWLVAPETIFGKDFPSWLCKNNLFSTTPYQWKRDSLFSVLKDSPFRGKGVDLSKKFIINGKEYEPLPGMKSGYFKGKNPDLGALQFGETFDSIKFKVLEEEGVLPN